MDNYVRSSGRYSDQYSDATASLITAVPPTQRVEGRGQRVDKDKEGAFGYVPALCSKTFVCKQQSVARETDACRSAARGGAR